MPRMSIRSIRYRRPKHPTWDVDLERGTIIERNSLPEPWDLSALFGRDAPVEVEIGFGKGRFILAAAQRWPDRNWLGIEYAAPCVQLVAERAAKRELRNIRLVRGDAAVIVAEAIPEASIDAYHIYFPDPWPKKRHHKRRLLKQPFAEHLLRTLKPSGCLHVATDFQDYFEEMVPAITAAGLTLVELPADRPEADEVFQTNYEAKFLALTAPIYRAVFRRPPRPFTPAKGPTGTFPPT